MKSNICKITNGISDLAAILNESAKVAVYNELDHKQTLQLRLLCEELDGMLPELIEEFEGDFWIEFEQSVCKVNVSIKLDDMDADKKSELVEISKSKKNAAATGIVGKIRSLVEDLYFNKDAYLAYSASPEPFESSAVYPNAVTYSYYWSLEQYKYTVKQENKEDAWDELEKSVISSVADDVIVGVKGKTVDIVIVKNFA